MFDKLNEKFRRNPGAWILAGLLAYSVYFHYQTGVKLTRVCELFSELEQEFSSAWDSQSYKQLRRICGNRLSSL